MGGFVPSNRLKAKMDDIMSNTAGKKDEGTVVKKVTKASEQQPKVTADRKSEQKSINNKTKSKDDLLEKTKSKELTADEVFREYETLHNRYGGVANIAPQTSTEFHLAILEREDIMAQINNYGGLDDPPPAELTKVRNILRSVLRALSTEEVQKFREKIGDNLKALEFFDMDYLYLKEKLKTVSKMDEALDLERPGQGVHGNSKYTLAHQSAGRRRRRGQGQAGRFRYRRKELGHHRRPSVRRLPPFWQRFQRCQVQRVNWPRAICQHELSSRHERYSSFTGPMQNFASPSSGKRGTLWPSQLDDDSGLQKQRFRRVPSSRSRRSGQPEIFRQRIQSHAIEVCGEKHARFDRRFRYDCRSRIVTTRNHY